MHVIHLVVVVIWRAPSMTGLWSSWRRAHSNTRSNTLPSKGNLTREHVLSMYNWTRRVDDMVSRARTWNGWTPFKINHKLPYGKIIVNVMNFSIYMYLHKQKQYAKKHAASISFITMLLYSAPQMSWYQTAIRNGGIRFCQRTLFLIVAGVETLASTAFNSMTLRSSFLDLLSHFQARITSQGKWPISLYVFVKDLCF